MKLIGLMVTLIALGLLFFFAYGRKADEPAPSPSAKPVASLGAAPPSDVATNAKAAREFVVHQSCLADCAAESRTCMAVATEPASVEACGQARAVCEKGCP